MSIVRENALRQRAVLQAQLKRVEEFLRLHALFSGDGEGLLTKPENPKKEAVAEAVRALIVEAGKPLSRQELLPLLAGRGLVVSGRDPSMVLNTMLWRMRQSSGITKLKGGRYEVSSKLVREVLA